MLCWVFYTDLYGRLNWRYIGTNDLNYNIMEAIDFNLLHMRS